MTDKHHNQTDLEHLFSAACDESLTPKELASLEEALAADPAIQDAYLAYCCAHAEMRMHVQSRRSIGAALSRVIEEATQNVTGRSELDATEITPRPKSLLQRASRHPKGPAFAIAVAVMLMVLGAMAVTPVSKWIAGSGSESEEERAPESEPEFVAKLTNWQEDEWLEGTRPRRREPRLEAGRRLKLAAGLAEVTFDNGAVVILEGPAEFEVLGKKSGYLRSGRLVARVEEKAAQGFFVDTPVGYVEDLGTEFGVVVRNDGGATVGVFDGVVKVVSSGESPETEQVHEDHTVHVSNSGAIREATAKETTLVAVSRHLRRRLAASAPVVASDHYRPAKVGETTAAFGDGRGLPGKHGGYWNYYSSATLNPTHDDANLTPLTYGAGGGAGMPCYAGRQGTHSMPAISNRELFNSGEDGRPKAGELAIHPSDENNEFAVVRWTAGEDTDNGVTIRGRVRILGSNAAQDGIHFAVFVAGEQVHETKVAAADNVGEPFRHTTKIEAGQHIDFVIGRNETFINDQTGLFVEIVATGPDAIDDANRITKEATAVARNTKTTE